MKPIQLIMTAFGPYKQREQIDFTELQDHRLFSISGKTGAGKTTIFDAICYALYGEASGEERNDTAMLRSHFAEDDVYTGVTLTFQIKDRIYEVMRQMAHRRKGNKTATGGALSLYEIVDGQRIPAVDRFHVTDVNRKVEEIIGLTKHQFSQIVMLPQGEFRKLLTSETENKEEILRRIFKTDRYKQMQSILDEKRKHLKSVLQGKQTERDLYFRRARELPIRSESLLETCAKQEVVNSYQMKVALKEEVAYYTQQLYRIGKEEERSQLELTTKRAALQQAEIVNAQWVELYSKREEQQQLAARETEMMKEKHRLYVAEEAQRITPFEAWYKEAKQTALMIEQEWKTALATKQQLQLRYEQAHRRYEEEKEKETLREDAKRHMTDLQAIESVVKTIATRAQHVQVLQRKLEDARQQLQKSEEALQRAQEEKRNIGAAYDSIETALQTYVEKTTALHRLEQDAKVFMQYQKDCTILETIAANQQHIQAKRDAAVHAYTQAEQTWLSEQAGQLALHLHDGMTCPVCGSAEHPQKAVITDRAVSKEQLQVLREQREEAERSWIGHEEEYKKQKEKCDQIAQEAHTLGYDVRNFAQEYTQLVTKGKLLRQDVQQLDQQKEQLTKLQEQRKKIDTHIESLMQQKQMYDQVFRDTEREELQQRLLYENDQQKLPEQIGITQWQEQMQQAQTTYEQLTAIWRETQEQYEQLKSSYIRQETLCQSLQNEYEKADALQREKEMSFQTHVTTAGFANITAYEAAKQSEANIQLLKQRMQTYETAVTAVAKQIEALETRLQGAEWTELTDMRVDIQELERLAKTLHEQQHTMKHVIASIDDLVAQIKRIDEQIQEEEGMYHELIDLYEVMKGDNDSRISFERYILIEYMEHIIQAANLRLRKLSNGQFLLQRSERVEKRNRQSGLGFDVYDTYTGQTRDVKTLSGGEKFNASLALALGMADVIQAHEGGVSIETMFIDEGFGSLDEESLTKAIDTLIDLQKSGRLIGVISHVQELKNTLPAALEVMKQKDGSSRTKFVIQ